MTSSMPVPADAVDPDATRGPLVIACAIVSWVVAAVFVALRFLTRGKIIHVLGPEDWCILVSLVFSAATSANMLEGAAYGLGEHIWNVDDEDVAPMGRAGWFCVLWYILSLAFTKVSILLLYLRILTYDYIRIAVYVIFAAVIISNIFGVVVTLTACIPLAAYWDRSVTATYCHPQSVWWANTGMHMVCDFLIFLVPLPVVFSLSIRWRQKLILSFVFGLGLFVCIISVLRLAWLLKLLHHADSTWDDVGISNWSEIEINTAIVCACLITLKPLCAKLFPRVFASRPHDDDDPSGSGGNDNAGRPLTVGSRRTRAIHKKKASWLGVETDLPDGSSVRLADIEAQLEAAVATGDDDALPKPPVACVRDRSGTGTSFDSQPTLGPQASMNSLRP